jgi:hypothetical protein
MSIEASGTMLHDDFHRRAYQREKLEESALIGLVSLVCSEINTRAGNLLVEAQSYLPPQALVRSFLFVNGPSEYVMQIAVCGSRSMLTFIERNWRDLSRNRLVRTLYELGALQPLRARTRFSCLIDEPSLTRAEVEKWFSYLLSGLQSKFEPNDRARFTGKLHRPRGTRF